MFHTGNSTDRDDAIHFVVEQIKITPQHEPIAYCFADGQFHKGFCILYTVMDVYSRKEWKSMKFQCDYEYYKRMYMCDWKNIEGTELPLTAIGLNDWASIDDWNWWQTDYMLYLEENKAQMEENEAIRKYNEDEYDDDDWDLNWYTKEPTTYKMKNAAFYCGTKICG